MDCEETYPVFLLYSRSKKLNAFGWSIKGYFDDPKFDHPNSNLAWVSKIVLNNLRNYLDILRTMAIAYPNF